MAFYQNPWLRSLYLSTTRGTSASVEWAWLVGRLAVATILILAVHSAFSGFDGVGAIPVLVGWVALYSVFLVFLLRRGCVRQTFLIGFILDNATLVIAWWFAFSRDELVGASNDLWLILLPITIVGVARTGPWIGLGYVIFMSGFLTWMTAWSQPVDSGSLEQLTVRLLFFGLTGAITAWLVSQLNLEREVAEELQEEAEILSDISQIFGSSLNPTDVFPQYSQLLQQIVPFGDLVLAERNEDGYSLEVLGKYPASDEAFSTGDHIDLPQDGEMLDWLTHRTPQLLDEEATTRLASVGGNTGAQLFSGARSVVISGVISGDRAIGTLIALSSEQEAFDTDHVRIVARIAELIGSSMTNMQVYSQAIQLANERDARLTLDAANHKLQEDNVARTFFLSAISHELRTPLTSIIAFNDLLLRNKTDNLSPRQLQQLELISKNSKQLATLVNDLLDLSYIGSGKVQMSPETFSPVDAIRMIVESTEPMLQEKQQRLNWGPQITEQVVIADKGRFAQVTANLISNASKYSTSNSEIEITWAIVNGQFELTVRDHGDGISAADQEHLFQPFFRAAEHRTSKIPGTGLGLVITRSLLEAHGGDISIKSYAEIEGESGTEVRIWFPADGNVLIENARLRQSA